MTDTQSEGGGLRNRRPSRLGTGRQRWQRAESSPQPSLDRLSQYNEKSDRLRLIDAMPAKPVSERDRAYVLRVLQVLLIVVVVGQRITLPIGSFPIALPLVAAYPIIERIWLKSYLAPEVLQDHSALAHAAETGRETAIDAVLNGEEHPVSHRF